MPEKIFEHIRKTKRQIKLILEILDPFPNLIEHPLRPAPQYDHLAKAVQILVYTGVGGSGQAIVFGGGAKAWTYGIGSRALVPGALPATR